MMMRHVGLGRTVTVGAVLTVLLAVAACTAAAAIRPSDQKQAERLTLRFADFGSGWNIKSRVLTRFRLSRCPEAPSVQRRATGFVDSAEFVQTTSAGYAASTTRVFPTVEQAKQWFAFAGGGSQARCLQDLDLDRLGSGGFKILPSTRQGDRSLPSCRCCAPERTGPADGRRVRKHEGQADV